MGIFDSITDFLGLSASNAQDALNGATPLEQFGNINLGGGLAGGVMNYSGAGQPLADVNGAQQQQANPGYGGSPLSQGDYATLNNNWGNLRRAANYGDINWSDPALKGATVSPEAQQFLTQNWGNIRRAANFGDINWAAGGGDKIIGMPNYAKPAAAPGAAPAPAAAGAGPTATQGMPGTGGANTTSGNLMQQFLNIAQNQSINPQAQGALQDAAMRGLTSTPQGVSDQYLQLMRDQSAPYEKQAMNLLNDNLFSRGRLGADDTATSDAYREFSKGLNLADLQRQLSAMQFGQTQQNNLFSQGIQALTAGSGLQDAALQRALGSIQGYGALAQTNALPVQLAMQLAQMQAQARLGIAGSASNNIDPLGRLTSDWGNFWGGVGGGAGGKAGGAGGTFAALSDVRMKHDIEYVGTVRGRRWYHWKWPDGSKGSGVMAHENLDIATVGKDGVLTVDYSKV